MKIREVLSKHKIGQLEYDTQILGCSSRKKNLLPLAIRKKTEPAAINPGYANDAAAGLYCFLLLAERRATFNLLIMKDTCNSPVATTISVCSCSVQ